MNLSLSSSSSAQNDDEGGVFPSYQKHGREKIPTKEKTLNFAFVYASQWAFYLASQEETIEKHGSFKKWRDNMFSPHFDKDSFEYNLFKHSLAGNYYYLFYRSRRYSERDAFFWSFMSSAAFEFTIENLTERPSWQDLYQTPIFGTVVGIGFEKASDYFFDWNTWYGDFLGYIINPMKLIPQFARKKAAAVTYVDGKKAVAMFTLWY